MQITNIIKVNILIIGLTIGSCSLVNSQSQFVPGSVADLIEKIEQPRAATTLKAGYFLRRSKTAQPPIEEGWQMLSSACDQATVSSKRWFLLQNVKASVAYNLPFVNPREGANAYSKIFKQAAQAPKVNMEYVVKSSVNEFVTRTSGKIQDLRVEDAASTQVAFVDAWHANVASSNYKDKFSLRVPRPDWIRALQIIGIPDGFADELKEDLKKPSPSFELLTLSAYVVGKDDPKEALQLQLKAKSLIPRTLENDIDVIQVNSYYGRLIDLYKLNGQDEEAAKMEQEKLALLKNH